MLTKAVITAAAAAAAVFRFESIGIDFRVLVMVRNAVDILLSTTVHRTFGGWAEFTHLYAGILNRDMLGNQLQVCGGRCATQRRVCVVPRATTATRRAAQ